MKRLRVVQIVNGLALNTKMGGAERFGVELARHLDKQKIESIVVGLWEWEPEIERKWRRQLADEDIATVVGAPKDDRHSVVNFVQAIAQIKRQFDAPVDIIHSQCDFGDVAALWLGRSLRAKALLRTAHNELEWAKRPLRRWLLVNGIYPFAFDAEFGVSKRAVEVLDRRLIARWLRKRAVVMHNAIDTSRFTPLSDDEVAGIRRMLGIDSSAPVIGSVGRLVEQKGYRYFLEAAVSVAATVPTARFLLIGSGGEESFLRTLANNLKLTDRVIFVGARDDVHRLLPIMDVFVSSSLWEGLPTVILEAMLASVPVVATAVAGTTELVEDGVTGVLAPPASSGQLAAAIVGVLAHRENARAMVSRGRDFVLANFDINVVARQQEVLYQRLASIC